jgi:hypothetical protein
MGLGNLICQTIAEKKTLDTVDYVRATKYAFFGLLISVSV